MKKYKIIILGEDYIEFLLLITAINKEKAIEKAREIYPEALDVY